MLKPGERFIMPGDGREFEVLRVGFFGAEVRLAEKKMVEFEAKKGKRSFRASGRVYVISANTRVESLSDSFKTGKGDE